jgi:hypothetical protein
LLAGPKERTGKRTLYIMLLLLLLLPVRSCLKDRMEVVREHGLLASLSRYNILFLLRTYR